MKKRTILIAVIAAALVVGGTATTLIADTPMRRFVESYFSSGDGTQETGAVAAKVNGKPILQKNVDAELTMYDVLATYVDVNGGNTSLPEEWQNKRPTQAEVLEKLIRNAVIDQEAERLKLTVSQEEARKVAAEQYQVLKDAASREDEANKDARGYYQSLVDYREARHITEEQYIDESANAYRAMLIRGKVRQAFLADYQGDDPDGAWETHLAELVAQANIEYLTAEK